MTSERKIKANRATARSSTGPKTEQGRSHAARNAVRHALSLPVYADPVLSEEVESITLINFWQNEAKKLNLFFDE